MELADKRIIHFRSPGNAPEIRYYVEAATEAAVADLLAASLGRIRAWAQGN